MLPLSMLKEKRRKFCQKRRQNKINWKTSKKYKKIKKKKNKGRIMSLRTKRKKAIEKI